MLTVRRRPTIALLGSIGVIQTQISVISSGAAISQFHILSILSFSKSSGSLKANVLKNKAANRQVIAKQIIPEEMLYTLSVFVSSSGAVTNTLYIAQNPHSMEEVKKQYSFLKNVSSKLK